MAYSFGPFALDNFASVTPVVDVCPCEPATGGTTDEGGRWGRAVALWSRRWRIAAARSPLDATAPVTSAVGGCPCEPATGGTTDEWLGLLLLLTGRVDGV